MQRTDEEKMKKKMKRSKRSLSGSKSMDKRVKQQYREINNKAIKRAIRDHKRRKRQFKIQSILGEVKEFKSIPSTKNREEETALCFN